MTPKAAVWAVWGVVCLCASDWRARAVIWEVFRGRKAPVANSGVLAFVNVLCQKWRDQYARKKRAGGVVRLTRSLLRAVRVVLHRQCIW